MLQIVADVRKPLDALDVFSSGTGMESVEALMAELCRGGRDEPIGAISLEHLATGGKRLRARLALAAAAALDVDLRDASGWAAACELLHNATLIHDDLQDGDTTRRGRPTVWAAHGMAQAINAGDLMLFLPTLAIERIAVSEAVRYRLAVSLARHACEVVRGQSSELELKHLFGTRELTSGYERCIRGKTAALFVLPVEGAALLAGFEPLAAREIAWAFDDAGLLFQIQDDVLDLYGDKGRNETGSDVREGKVSSLVVEHLALHPEDREWLWRILSTPRDETSDADVAEVIVRFREGGALDASLSRVRELARRIEGHDVLTQHENLRALGAALVEQIVAPIRHLLG